MVVAFKQFNNVPDLPYTIKQGGKPDIIFNWIPFENIPEVYDFWVKYAFQDDGCSHDEFTSADDFAKKAYGRLTFYCHVVGSGRVVGFYQLMRSTICRSLETNYYAGYAIRDPEYKGVARVAQGLLFQISKAEGKRGILARTTPLSTGAYLGGYLNGSSQLGCIPMSVYVPKFGWVDDLILHNPFGSWKTQTDRQFPSLPRCTIPARDSIPRSYAAFIDKKNYTLGEHTITVCVADDSQRLAVEGMLHDAAMQGQSIGLDEFNTDGTYARRTFRDSITIVLEDRKGTCLGGMFCGSSNIPRTKESPILGFQLILPLQSSSDAETMKLGDIFYSTVKTLARHHKCYGILTDILTTDQETLQIAYRNGMMTVGGIPDSTYLKDDVYTGSLLMHHKLLPTPNL